ncbi:AVAST type 2 anti-phage system protein Avs2 [Paenibacillus polymyxa]|uniref:AVAST type 2 anti-phage system protein Avs2 n=1 Tax=Paenibacillus polymyxa TaxID=1406 RepID=UPI00298CB0C1|nr:AVAST type 2 anti-phage system protein Avs2 [Paenibacillus polymyxa]
MPQFNWLNIRSFSNSQNNAFEELICQLAREEDIHGKVSFTRVGAPDGGVESYCKLETGEEYGWQAKYFVSMGDSQWKQLEKSFKTAFLKHPKLTKYYICIPLDRQDPRIDNQKWFMDKWNDYISEWNNFAEIQNRSIEFEYWGSSELLSRLSQEKHAGRVRFWFNDEEFSQRWFDEKLQLSMDSLGHRYTPELNYELDIAKTFDGVARDRGFKNQMDEVYNEFLKRIKKAMSMVREESLIELKDKITINYKTMNDYYYNIIFNEMEDIDLELISNTCKDIDNLIWECMEQFEKINLKEHEEKERKINKYAENNKFSSEINYLKQVHSAISQLQNFVNSPTALLANSGVLILKGDAGIGKSHLLADVAKKKNANGNPAILLLGQHFINDQNPWTQILRNQLRLNMNEEEFLGALNSKAQSMGVRLLFIVDAINEGRGKYFWKDHVKGFIRTIKKYKWLGLVLSIRTSYEEAILPLDLITEKIAVRVTHYGFTDVEYEASKMFFDNYNIQQPSIPLLHPEFQNPLFLKLFCQGLFKAGLNHIPDGFEGITKILDFFVISVNNRLSEPTRFDYSNNINLVQKAIMAIIAEKLKKNSQYLRFEEANEIVCNEVKEYTEKWRQFLNELINEGILTLNLFYVSSNEYVNGVYFAYERFDDHITASFLLDKHLNIDNPMETFENNQSLNELVKDETSCYRNKGLIEAFSIQIPEKIGMEFFEIAPFCKSYYPVIDAFVNGLLWRKTNTINENIIPYINEHVLRRRGTYENFWDTVLQVSSNPKHFFNGYKIHEHLMKFSLADRDAEWTQYISPRFSGNSAIKRLIDWAWTVEDRSYISDESVKLSALTISWFLASPNRKLRDYSTKALICLLRNRINILVDVLRMFEKVNDPYVYERLFAVAYGCALRTEKKMDIEYLCNYIYSTIFDKEQIYPHILLRDYSRGVIEYALYSGIQIDVDLKKVSPPYRSEWYIKKPTIQEIDDYYYDYKSKDFKNHYWAQKNILDSMTTEYGRGTGAYGDFGRYIFQSAVSNWKEHFDPQELSNIATQRVFELGYNVEIHGEYDFHEVGSSDRYEHSNERIGKKYQWIAFHELLAKLTDNYSMSEIDYGWHDESEDDSDDFDMIEWIKSLESLPVQSVESEIEEELYQENKSETSITSKRKYKKVHYNGPWNPFVRDIDPTILITQIDQNNRNYYADIYDLPESDLDKWVHDFKEIPKLDNIFLTSRNGKDFILLSSHIKWLRQEDEDDYKNRQELFVKTTALLVPTELTTHYSESKKVHDYSYGNHWESDYKMFASEFYWHPVYKEYRSEAGEHLDTRSEVKTTTFEYRWEKGYDKSIIDSVSFLMPSEFIVNELGLSQLKEGYWYNSNDEIICYDVALEGYNTGLLIEKNSLEKMLIEKNMSIIWDVYLEKVANKELHECRMVTALKDGQITIENIYDEANWPL